MISQIKKLYDWMGSFVNTKHASPVLGFLFFLEAIFFVPTDPILILYCIKQRERALFFATVATIGSVLGGIASYCIGFALWQTAGEQIIHNHLVNYVLSPKHFYSLSSRFQQNEWLAILIAGFTPVPYKAATLAAGFCKISFIPFVLCSFIARGARFFLFAVGIKYFGEKIQDSLDQFSYVMLFGIIIATAVTIWLYI